MSETPTPESPEVPVATPPTEEGSGLAWWAWLLVALGVVLALVAIYLLFIKEPEPTYEVDYDALEDILDEVEPSPSPSPSPSESPSPTPTVTVTATPSPSPSASATPSAEPSPEPSPSPEPPDPVDPATEFGPGIFEVGVDVAPGTYRTSGVVAPNASAPCGWAIAHEGVTERKDLIGNPAVQGGIPTLTVVAGDRVGMRDCPTFVQVNAGSLFQNGNAASEATPGVWLVGEDILPGTYERVPTAGTKEANAGCYALVTVSLSNNYQTAVFFSEPETNASTVVLAAGQQFQSANCGNWERVS